MANVPRRGRYEAALIWIIELSPWVIFVWLVWLVR
jgi:hypothetical protein